MGRCALNFLGFCCSLTESSIKPTTKSWFYYSSPIVMKEVLSSSQFVSVSSAFLRADRFLPFFFFFFPFTFMSWVRFAQSSLRREWYSSTPPNCSVNSYSAAGVAVAAPPLTFALTLTGPPPPGAVLPARLRPATESARIVDEAGVALRRRLAPKPKPPLLLWKGSSSSSSLSENSFRRFSFLYSSMRRRKSKINFLMISICEQQQRHTQG